MDTLRIILIIIGIIFVFGIYLFQTKTAPTKILFSLLAVMNKLLNKCKIYLTSMKSYFRDTEKSDVIDNQLQPVKHSRDQLSNEQLASMSDIIASKLNVNPIKNKDTQVNLKSDTSSYSVVDANTKAGSVPKGKELLITLTILPKPGNLFNGVDIVSACKLAGLQLGEYNIFHRYALVDDKVLMTPVCSLVNLFEPGYFDLASIESFTTEGLSLFMQLPGPIDGRDAFIILMDVSDKLSNNLNATICDETRSVITAQTISHLKDKVENFRFKIKMDSIKQH